MNDVIFYVFWGGIIGGSAVSGVRSVISFKKAYTKAKAAGIVKILRRWTFYVNIILSAVILVSAVKNFSGAADYSKKAADYELLKDSSGFADYLKDTISEREGIEISDPQQYISNYIKRLNNDANTQRIMGVCEIVLAAACLSFCLDSLWLFTVDGLIGSGVKEIEPVVAERKAGKIHIWIKAVLKSGMANARCALTVNDTPKNLAVFGRYFEQEDEITAQEPIALN